MATQQEPVIGSWYVNLNNQFLRVWAMVFDQGQPRRVVLHYLNGMRFVVDLEAWHQMKLERYPSQKEQRSGATTQA